MIYHVSNESSTKSSSVASKSAEELRTFALTTITEKGSATRKTASKLEDEMHFEKVEY